MHHSLGPHKSKSAFSFLMVHADSVFPYSDPAQQLLALHLSRAFKARNLTALHLLTKAECGSLCTLLMPALVRQRQVYLCELPSLYSKFQDSQGYEETSTKNTNKNVSQVSKNQLDMNIPVCLRYPEVTEAAHVDDSLP